jgi:hypothetical protein
MSKSRIGPEAKVIALFAALPDDSKRIVLDVIKSQSAIPRKATKKAEKPSASPAAHKETVPGKEAKCGVCYEVEDHPNHDATYLSSHKFDAPKAGRKSRKKADAPVVIPISDTGADGNGLAAEMES